MRRVPVDSSRTNEVRNGSRPISSSSSSRAGRRAFLVVERPSAGAARRRARCGVSTQRSRATSSVSCTVISGNSSASWKLRPRPAAARAAGDSVRDVVAGEQDLAVVEREEAGDEVEDRRLAGAVRAR